MTRLTSRSGSFAPRFAGRAAAALALSLGIAGLAAPASADCSASPMTMSAGGGQTYTCTRNCVAGGSVLTTVFFTGHDATVSQCIAECTRTLGCTHVTYRVSTEMRDGLPFTRLACVLQRGGASSTSDSPPMGPGGYSGVCYRDPPGGLWRHVQIDTRILTPDQMRPGLPNPAAVPFKK